MGTKEEIQQSINERLISPPTQIEGSVMQDIIGSVAYELANIIDTRIDVILDNAFITTADIEHLEIKGGELGINRKQATCAVVFVKVTGASINTTIDSTIIAKTDENILFQAAEEVTTDENGFAEFKMVAIKEGEIGNVSANSINAFYENYIGLIGAEITNENAAYGGYEAEDVEEYRERVLEYVRENAANSNIADYIQWAKSIEGVKNVLVKDAITAGAGHVMVYVSSTDNMVTQDMLNKVKEKIEKEQIVNAIVEVFALENFAVNISAELSIKAGYSLDVIKMEFIKLLKAYLNKNPRIISYLYISNLFFEIDGILDVSNYLLNGSVSSLNLDEYEVPVIGEIVLGENE